MKLGFLPGVTGGRRGPRRRRGRAAQACVRGPGVGPRQMGWDEQVAAGVRGGALGTGRCFPAPGRHVRRPEPGGREGGCACQPARRRVHGGAAHLAAGSWRATAAVRRRRPDRRALAALQW